MPHRPRVSKIQSFFGLREDWDSCRIIILCYPILRNSGQGDLRSIIFKKWPALEDAYCFIAPCTRSKLEAQSRYNSLLSATYTANGAGFFSSCPRASGGLSRNALRVTLLLKIIESKGLDFAHPECQRFISYDNYQQKVLQKMTLTKINNCAMNN